METIYFAGGCLWGVQAFVKTLPGVVCTEAGRANGTSNTLEGAYDGYAECVKTEFDPEKVTLERLISYFFEIIDPYSVNRQGEDVGEKYRTGIYSENEAHLEVARAFIQKREDARQIVVEVLPLENYVKSAEEHQDRLTRCPDDYCHLPMEMLTKYKKMSILDWVAKVEALELELCKFNAERALADVDKTLEVLKIGHSTLLVENNSPRSPYYNRIKGFGEKDVDKIDQILSVYEDRKVTTCFDISPNHFSEAVVKALRSRGFESEAQLVFMRLSNLVPLAGEDQFKIVEVNAENAEAFIALILKSNEGMEVSESVIQKKKPYFFRPNFHNYIAYLDGEAAGMGSLFVHGDMGYIANDFTFEAYRGKGCQKSLLRYRINAAISLGLTSLVTDVEFGTISHDNMETLGFKTVFMNAFWMK